MANMGTGRVPLLIGFAAVVGGLKEFSRAPGKSELTDTVHTIKITMTCLYLESCSKPLHLDLLVDRGKILSAVYEPKRMKTTKAQPGQSP